MRIRTVRAIVLCGVLFLAGCGGSENKVFVPEDPEPLPPGGVQLQPLEDADAPPPIHVEP
jgi:hypothetical protein